MNSVYAASLAPDCVLPPTLAQRSAHKQILKQLATAPRSATVYTQREAAKQLLQTGHSYQAEVATSTVRSYSRADVSIPEVGAHAPMCIEVIDSIGREILQDPQRTMLLDCQQWGEVLEKGEKVVPYMDECLKKDPVLYQQFIHDLFTRGMIRFRNHAKSLIPPFFVIKKMVSFDWC